MKLILKLLAACLAFIVLGLVSLSLYIANIDPNQEKDRIITAFQERTGRDLSLAGNVSMTVYPWLGFTLDDVSISNPPGFPESPFLQAGHMALRIKLVPMLSGRFEIDTVQMHGIRINLVTALDGSNNWQDFFPDSESATSTPPASNSFSPDDLILGGVDIRDFAIHYTDQSSETAYAVEDLRFQTGALVYGQPIDIDFGFNASSEKPALQAEVALAGTVLYDLDNGRYQLDPLRLATTIRGPRVPGGAAVVELSTGVTVDLGAETLTVAALELTAPDTRISASINGTGIGTPNPVYQASLSVDGSDLAQLFRIADIQPLANQLAELDNRAFTLQTNLNLEPGSGSIAMDALQAGLLGSTVSGDLLAANLQGDEPSVRGQLLASGPDLPSVVEVLGQLAGGRDSQLAQAGRELRQVADRNFSIQTEFDADFQTGVLVVPTLELVLLGSTVTGNVSALRINTDQPLVSGALRMDGADLPLLLQIAGRFQGGTESPLFGFGESLAGSGNKAFHLDTAFEADLQNGDIRLSTLNASALGMDLNGQLDARNMDSNGGSVSGRLALVGTRLREVLGAAGQAELGDVVQSANVEIGVSGNRQALSLNPVQLQVTLSGPRIPNSPVLVSASAATEINLDQETLKISAFTLNGLGLDAQGNLEMNSLLSAPEYQGTVALTPFNLRRLLQQLNQPLPDTSDPDVLQEIGLALDFSGTSSLVALRDITIDLDATAVRGEVSVENFSEPDIRFDLAIDDINADRYLAPADPGAASENGAESPLPVDMLRGIRINGDLEVGRVQFSGIALSDLSLTARLADGNLELSPLHASLYQGSVDGSLRLDASQQSPRASLDLDLQQVAIADLMTDLMGSAQVSGRGLIQLSLAGSGNSVSELKGGLGGNGRVVLEDGILTGVDVAAVLTQLETLLRTRRLGEINRGEQTAFDSFAATLLVNDGVVTSNDLLIRSPGFQVSGRGTLADLRDDSISYDLLTSVDRSTATLDSEEFDIGGYSLPIACTGTLSAPRCLPDSGEILRAALAREAQRRVGDLLDRALGNDAPDATAPTTPDAGNATQTPAPPEPVDDPTTRLLNRALDRLRDN